MSLFFKKYGNGDKVLIAFHGFGGSHSDWEVFVPALGDEYTIYAFDLWHHANSAFECRRLSKHEFEIVFQRFLSDNQIYTFSLMGYSLGGRICFQIIELFPGKINQVFLFAPDGLHRNPLYRLATLTKTGSFIFKQTMINPSFFFACVRFFAFLRVLHPQIKTFILKNLSTAQNRMLVYNSWITTSKLWPDLYALEKNINRYEMKLSFFLGKDDRMIRISWMKKLTNRLHKSKYEMMLLPAGHKLQTERIRKLIWGK